MKKIFALVLCMAVLHPVYAQEFLRLATTTSTENTGLLSVLHRPFEEKTGVKVHVIAVGTGKALRLGQDGDVDVVLVHAPAAEQEFVADGHGVERQPVMHNDFVLLGPPEDPAQVKLAVSLADAMSRIHHSGHDFVSRGDDSGTHKKELELWSIAGIKPEGENYLAVGQGMGQVLQIANDKLAYTLSDRGTYLAAMDKLDLIIVYEQAAELANPYHVILVNPHRHPHVRADLARAYSAFLRGPEGQGIIRDYRVNGHQLFFPDVLP
jgi:tungstate transport system substrate-binding protein